MRVTLPLLEALNERFHNRPPLELLRFAHEIFGPRAAILASMQRAGTTLCHMADRAGLSFDVLFVDTGVLHAETRETRDALASTHRRLRVITLYPERTFAAQMAAEGLLYLRPEGQERCCELRKTAPLVTQKGRYDALIGSLQRQDGGARAHVRPFAVDPSMNVLRIHPFASTSQEELAAYIAEHPDVIVNPLHAMGFPSIGCFPCTTPARPGEPKRAGRWRHLADVAYCGINPTDRGAPSDEIEIDDRYAGVLGAAPHALACEPGFAPGRP
jgi:phosphoadenosine phosphosulfate reductase